MVIENYYVNYQNYQNPPWILEEHWCIYSCLQIPPRENWFQNERREYARAINFPCLITMAQSNSYSRKGGQCYLAAPPLGAETPLKINASSFPGGAEPPPPVYASGWDYKWVPCSFSTNSFQFHFYFTFSDEFSKIF